MTTDPTDTSTSLSEGMGPGSAAEAQQSSAAAASARWDKRDARPHVVVIGGGFAGIFAMRQLVKTRKIRVTLIDRNNYHLFQPLLYQVATSGLSPANICAPLRRLFGRYEHVDIRLGEVTGIDADARTVALADGSALAYDALIVGTGMTNHYFGNDAWERDAPGLKSIEEALEIRRRILLAFERADNERDVAMRKEWLTFVLIGAGPTGVEMAGTIAEIARDVLRGEFRHIDPSEAKVLLVEGQDRVLPAMASESSTAAKKQLEQLGVTVWLNRMVQAVSATSVTIGPAKGESAGEPEAVPSRTVVWAAGVAASPLARTVAEACRVEPDRQGRVPVQSDCSVAGYPRLFVLGDAANHPGEDGQPLPGVAPVAIQQGHYVGRMLRREYAKAYPPERQPFHYTNKGMAATIGRHAAVAEIGPTKFSGLVAWLVWLLIHLLYLVGFANRVLVLFQWAASYFSFNRSARLITGSWATRFNDERPEPRS